MGRSVKSPEKSPDEVEAEVKARAEARRVKAEEEAQLARDNMARAMGLRGRGALFSSAGEVGFPLPLGGV